MSKLIAALEEIKDLPAIVNAGADEVCIALEGYSSSAMKKMRFSELEYALQFCKTMGKDVSILVNKFFHEGDLAKLDTLKEWVQTHPICALYFGDLAVANVFHNVEVQLVYMPDTLVTSTNDANFWHEQKIGTVISPLLTIEETLQIAKDTEGSIAIVHGRTNLSHSYRQLLSGWKQEYESALAIKENRSLYLVEEKRDGKMPVYEDETGTMIYADYILDSFDEMEDLMQTNVSGFMVNGLFEERKEYLDAIHSYRRILDGEQSSLVRKEYEERNNRVISSGYYHEKTVR